MKIMDGQIIYLFYKTLPAVNFLFASILKANLGEFDKIWKWPYFDQRALLNITITDFANRSQARYVYKSLKGDPEAKKRKQIL